MELVRPPAGTSTSPAIAPNGGSRDRREVFHTTFDPESEHVAQVVAESVAAIQNREVEELEPLSNAIDVRSLDELVSSAREVQSGVEEVQFVYEGMAVTIGADGDVWLKWR